jgi:excisionase family DNA binding protein
MRYLSASLATESAQRGPASTRVVEMPQRLQRSGESSQPPSHAIGEADPPGQIQSEIPVSPRKGKKRLVARRLPRPEPEPEASLNESEMMTLREAAEYLNCHYSTVLRLAHRGEIPGFRVGGGWRVSRSEMDRWIVARQVQPPENVVDKPDRRGRHKRKLKPTA